MQIVLREMAKTFHGFKQAYPIFFTAFGSFAAATPTNMSTQITVDYSIKMRLKLKLFLRTTALINVSIWQIIHHRIDIIDATDFSCAL